MKSLKFSTVYFVHRGYLSEKMIWLYDVPYILFLKAIISG